jgi:hypothetical protein
MAAPGSQERTKGVSDIPFRMARRPRDDRGFAVPAVQFIDQNGKPDFRVLDHRLMGKTLRGRRCGLCGDPIRKNVWFIGGPKCVDNGFFYDPPMHKECATYALQTCPHLARSKGKYSPVPDRIDGATMIVGQMDDKKSEWFGLMESTGYTFEPSGDGMMLIKATMPWVSVERWRDGSLMQEHMMRDSRNKK